mgnify:CR=1 FL=1
MENKYITYMLSSSFILLLGIIFLNYTVDPGNIYHSQTSSVKKFVQSLVHSKCGLWWPDGSFNERAVKKELIAYGAGDCVVIGSSHVMQLGNNNLNGVWHNICKHILNLGVSGAGIEDHFIYAYLASRNNHVKKIILGIDPWTFAYNKDERYHFLDKQYHKARAVIIGRSQKKYNHNTRSLVLNLINLQYTKRSLLQLTSLWKVNKKLFNYKNFVSVDNAHGGKYPLFLPDGSLVYSSSFISESLKNNAGITDSIYKTDGEINQENAVSDYKILIIWLIKNHIQPVLLMTPYHPSSWKNKDSSNHKAFHATSKIVHQLANEFHLQVIGSYQPILAGCMPTEFYDFMHPTRTCINKLNLRNYG